MAKEHSNDDIHAKLNLLVSEFKNMKEEIRGSAFSAQEEAKFFKKEKGVTWLFNETEYNSSSTRTLQAV
ncbi:hypothetical protein DPMN_107784 [Dreissena polymorpha]|uniref:Uncharacterized protein n=1 Tax=Dreissena polymorpha TaxID=45954 RepID=A0A9D4K7F1_DREPO|nr:hypothetical protein DPMN_107784 [Dreissena polymorpha]